MDIAVLVLFSVLLLLCVIADVSVVYAMLAGYLLFSFYALYRKFKIKDIIRMSLDGVNTAKNILVTFMLIGVLTALWRAGGTIPAIVSFTTKFMTPSTFVLFAFLVNCLVSFLTGTAFGTAATMGAICVTLSEALGVNPVMTGGAILSGAYFGDRCSFVSTSALLVSTLTKTKLHDNMKGMVKTAAVPFAVTCVFYIIYGLVMPSSGVADTSVTDVFSEYFNMGFFAFLPAFVMLGLSFARVNVKITMLVTIVCSALVCVFNENVSVLDVARYSVLGFSPDNEKVAAMLSGGGVVSMLRVSLIVFVSSCYSGIFRKTGLLDSLKKIIRKLSKRATNFELVLVTSVFSSMIACNQTLSIMLTHQICEEFEKDKEKMAIFLENSAVVVAPLVPWSIACATVFDSSGAPGNSFVTALFLFLVPIWNLVYERIKYLKSKIETKSVDN